MNSIPAFLLALAVSLPAASQVATPPSAPAQSTPQSATRIVGTVTALSDEGLTVRDATGKEVKVGFAPGVTVLASRPISKDDIKPGDFVASANLSETEGVGRSIEMRLFEAGSRAGEGNRPMTQPGAAPNQVMTNATVTKVARTAAGLELDVQYPGGSRHLIVPPEVTILGSYPVDPSMLKSGTAVTLTAIPGSDGALRATRIQISAAPATR